MASRARAAELQDAPLIVDGTAVGEIVLDQLRNAPAGHRVVPVFITAGYGVQRAEGVGWLVPKKELVSVLQMVLQTRRLKVAPELAEADLLTTELANFRLRRVVLGDAASAEWREGRHDDLLFAVALTCWHAERFGSASPFVDGPFIVWPTGEVDERPWLNDWYWDDDSDDFARPAW